MKTNNFLKVFFIFASAIIMLISCNSRPSNENPNDDGTLSKSQGTTVNSDQPLNVSVYLDLSDRLTRQMTPSQKDRDIEIVSNLCTIVKSHAVSQKILPSKDRIKVFFYPSPADSKIGLLSKDLEMDLSQCQPAAKKKELQTLSEKFKKSLEQIYQSTLASKQWIGSDIWGFFKKQVDAYCIKKGYRNIIVILTDGYIFYAPNKQNSGNAYNYILPQTLDVNDSKLMVARKGLEDLEVLLLEINPYNPQHQDKMEKILCDWFTEMGIKSNNIYIGETDQPSNTKLIIDNFMTRSEQE